MVTTSHSQICHASSRRLHLVRLAQWPARALESTSTSPRGQFQDYINIQKEKGPDGLVSAMEKTGDVGRLSPTGFVGSGFRFPRFRPTADGGMHIVMVTNRPMFNKKNELEIENYGQKPFRLANVYLPK
jgi:hypothetical protein